MAEPTLTQQTVASDTAKIPSYKSTGFTYTLSQPLNYPLGNSSKSDHFVRFWINLDEESRMFTSQNLTVLGNVDQTDQNRLRKRPIDQGTFGTAATIGGAVAGANKGLQASLNNLKGFSGNPALKAAIVAIDTTIGAGAGAAAGYYISKEIKIDKKLKRLATSITLYTPATITNSQQTRWDNYGDVMADLLQNVGSMDDVANSVKNGGISAASDRTKKTLAAVGRVIATSASDLVQSATRTAVNPKTDLLFKSIERRTFSFDYMFAPKSALEAIEVANIIQAFRLFSAPEVIQGTMEYLYTYPAEFDIEYGFVKDGVEEQNKFLNKISSCVLESVSINYAPGGTFHTLEAGEPVQVQMTLHFRELETLHRDRIAAGY